MKDGQTFLFLTVRHVTTNPSSYKLFTFQTFFQLISAVKKELLRKLSAIFLSIHMSFPCQHRPSIASAPHFLAMMSDYRGTDGTLPGYTVLGTIRISQHDAAVRKKQTTKNNKPYRHPYQYIPAIFERSNSKDCRAKYILVLSLLGGKKTNKTT